VKAGKEFVFVPNEIRGIPKEIGVAVDERIKVADKMVEFNNLSNINSFDNIPNDAIKII